MDALDLQNVVEEMIDASSVAAVADAIEEVCNGKAEHLLTNWQDRGAAKAWERLARAAARLAASAEKEGL